MCVTQRSLFAAVLLLGIVVANATPAAGQLPADGRGIWVQTEFWAAWTLTVANLTNHPLSLVTNSVTPGKPGTSQQPPFLGDATCDANTTALCLPIAPYRNVTWRSNNTQGTWKGALSFLPQGMDPKWTVTLNFRPEGYRPNNPSYLSGTWVYLTADFAANPYWNDVSPYNISCSYPGWYGTEYNVMTLSGTHLAVTLYASYVPSTGVPTVDVTLVFRQRWPHTQVTNGYQDSLVMPCLRYLDYQFTF